MPHQRSTALTGSAGEHFVVCELLKRGYIASLVPDGVPNCDVLVTDISGSRLAAIQVKTRWNIGSDGGWHMSKKHEHISGERLFYCFVDFGNSPDDQPNVFVVPSEVVADLLGRAHQAWLSSPGAKGQQRKDTDLRRLRPDYSQILMDDDRFHDGWMGKYKRAWHLLELNKITE
ncbi:hypothetical protein ACQKH5_01350 [Hyphomonas sp. NPDC076900]|uniref:hypothetical protein n=1 Tax=unclassified Hyphomonas TaxID=2630699 RepID=UPI003D028C07